MVTSDTPEWAAALVGLSSQGDQSADAGLLTQPEDNTSEDDESIGELVQRLLHKHAAVSEPPAPDVPLADLGIDRLAVVAVLIEAQQKLQVVLSDEVLCQPTTVGDIEELLSSAHAAMGEDA